MAVHFAVENPIKLTKLCANSDENGAIAQIQEAPSPAQSPGVACPQARRIELRFIFQQGIHRITCAGWFGGKEFALSGFGIADFVWIAWRNAINPNEGNAVSVEKLKPLLNQHKLTAFEMKLSDWRKGFAQAYRYSYFADLSVVVLPPDLAAAAKAELDFFRRAKVGLWSFDPATDTIRKLFSPRRSGPRNPRAKEKALKLLGRSLQFSQLRK